MWEKPRILPILALAAAALFVLKCISVWADVGTAFEAFGSAHAADHAAVENAKNENAQDTSAHEDKTSTPATATHDEGEEDERSAEAGTAPTDEEDQAFASATEDSASPEGESLQYTRAEVEVLQNLSARRAELDKRAREIDLKEKLLSASEQRVSERIAELKSIEANIQTLLAARTDAEEGRLKSLVKVYENMKPKDAARIFEELEMDILLPVAQHMKEAKFALILAQMNPEKAKRLTVSLAKQLELPERKSPEQKG